MTSNPPSSPSEKEIQEVAELLAEANNVGNQSTSFAGQRLRVCCAIGAKLNAWRQAIPKREWETFLSTHLPDLTESTRRRWMRLAEMEAKGTLDLDSTRGLRHAYQLAELLPDPEGGGSKGSKEETYITHLNRLMIALGKIDLETLSVRQRHDIRERLQVVGVFIGKLT